jgi:hypothetical protein
VRYAVALAGAATAIDRFLSARQAWNDWHQWAASDPSLADFFRTSFWVDAGTGAFALGIAAFIFWLLGLGPPGKDSGGVR